MSTSAPSPRGPGLARWVWTALTSILLVAAVGHPYWRGWLEGDAPGGDGAHAPAVGAAPAAGPEVADEARYYVFLSGLEVAPKDADGDKWDTRGGAPDLYYEVRWQNQVVFESSKKSDTLVAKWNSSEVGVGDLVRSVSIDSAIKAARITARENGVLKFTVWDADVARDDKIAEWTVPVASLTVGEQTWPRPAGEESPLVSATCRVLHVDGVDLKELTR